MAWDGAEWLVYRGKWETVIAVSFGSDRRMMYMGMGLGLGMGMEWNQDE